MAVHKIEPVEGNVHGSFSRDFPPILTIDSGDTVIYRTLDAGWGLEPQTGHEPRKRLPKPDEKNHNGHAMCGPIAIRGAEPGMTLEAHIKTIEVGGWGWSSGGWDWTRNLHKKLRLPEGEVTHVWTLDKQTLTGRNQYGHVVALSPFMGVMGLAPAEPGYLSTRPPRHFGGNLDCKDLIAGSKLYLPIQVSGALFSVGDGHAVQGQGEVSGVAIECPMDKVEISFTVRDDMPLETPIANTPRAWIALGFHKKLDEARWPALNGILDIIMREYNVGRLDALSLASLVVDLHVTQLVNDVQGIHAVLPHGAIKT